MDLFNIPSYGSMNLHASLLPKYRGAAPIQRCIQNGESTTGVTTFIINKGIDLGDMVLQRKIPINVLDNYQIIYEKLSQIEKVEEEKVD